MKQYLLLQLPQQEAPEREGGRHTENNVQAIQTTTLATFKQGKMQVCDVYVEEVILNYFSTSSAKPPPSTSTYYRAT